MAVAPIKKRPCMIEGCPSKIYTRGVCRIHYNMIDKLVRKGKRTWWDFARVGMCDMRRARVAFKEDLLNDEINRKLK